jgi:hypothetical protein
VALGKDKPGKPHKPPPATGVSDSEEEQAIRDAVSSFAPQADDRYQDLDTIVQRLAEILDRILGRWTLGMEQPVGPSGVGVVAPSAEPAAVVSAAPPSSPRRRSGRS